MILRPSNISVSFHQLRHYVQTKVTELVATAHQLPSTVVTQLTNYSTTQQTVVSFSDIKCTAIKRVHYSQQLLKTNANNENLLNMTQRHFPAAKVFSQPTLHGRSVMWANIKPFQQLRTIVSFSGGGSTCFSYGLPRSAMVGLGRNNGFGATRQFSTTKTPLAVIQTAQQPNVIAHISSRIFSPTGTKMTQPTVTEEKPKFVPFYSSQKDLSSSSSSEVSMYSNKYHFVRVFKNTTKGMADLLNTQAQETEKVYVVHAVNLCRNNKRKACKKFDLIVYHDGMSCLRNDGNIKQVKRRLNGTIISRLSRARYPPDHERKKITTSVYLLFDLKPEPFSSDWTTQDLGPSFIDSLENMGRAYRVRIHNMLKILDDLRFSGKKFRVVVCNTELRVYFPSYDAPNSEDKALKYLNKLGVQLNNELYTIIVENSYADPIVRIDYFKEIQLFLDCTESFMQYNSPFLSH